MLSLDTHAFVYTVEDERLYRRLKRRTAAWRRRLEGSGYRS